MELTDILSPARTLSQVRIENKKRAFDLISNIAAQELADTTPQSILEALTERERLGTTILGHGIAMPHARVEQIDQPMAILLNLEEPILYDEQDHQRVNIIIALLLPKENDQKCLECLASITKAFRRRSFRQRVAHAMNDTELYDLAIGNEK